MLRFLENQFVKLGRSQQSNSFGNAVLNKLRKIVNMPMFAGIKLRYLIVPKVRQAVTTLCGPVDFAAYEKEALKSYSVKNDFGLKQSGVYNLLLLHILVRLKKPEVVIETGISSGRSAAAVLEALKLNNKGTLYSFDLDPTDNARIEATKNEANGEAYRTYADYAPEDAKGPGWLVPEDLKARWKVILGDSNVELPKFAETVASVDIFYHDSDHTYETMMNEFMAVWSKLPEGGVLLADNSTASTAFAELSETYKDNVSAKFYYAGLDALIKTNTKT